MIEHAIALEEESPAEWPLLEHQGQPQQIVLPHAVVGNGVHGRPQRNRFRGFPGLAVAAFRPEDGDVQRQAVGELEEEFPAEPWFEPLA